MRAWFILNTVPVSSSVERTPSAKAGWIITAVLFSILLSTSVFRFYGFRADAFDFGVFDQALWLIGSNQPAYSSLLHRHILGDHFAWILYCIAPLCSLVSSSLTLFIIQAAALSSGVIASVRLAEKSGLSTLSGIAIGLTYALHPIVFNNNLFDFHPDVFAPPLMIGSLLAFRANRPALGMLAAILMLGCKEVDAVTVALFGLWIAAHEKRFMLGLVLAVAASIYFWSVTQYAIAAFSGGQSSAGIERFATYGNSPASIAQYVLSHPLTVMREINWKQTRYYILWILLPCAPVLLRPKALICLFPALGAFSINVLSSLDVQRSVSFQYSLCILPFLIFSSIELLKSRALKPQTFVAWTVIAVCFFTVRNFAKVGAEYPHGWKPLSTRNQLLEAILFIRPDDSVLTSSWAAAHLARRSTIALLQNREYSEQPGSFDVILLDEENPGWLSDSHFVHKVRERLLKSEKFMLMYDQGGVTLFRRQKN